MQKFFFDMKDGVALRDAIGVEFKTNAEAIGHCREIAQHFRDESLRDDQDLEISVVNALGREIHREFVGAAATKLLRPIFLSCYVFPARDTPSCS
jgi:hypothetical protein